MSLPSERADIDDTLDTAHEAREERRLETRRGLTAATVVGVIRDVEADRADRIARALLEGGLQAVEITATTPGAFGTVARLSETHPDAVLGVGTVRTLAELEAAHAARARFVVSPHTDGELIRAAVARGLVAIPGGLTPTEIVSAADSGADFVKVFPISAVGGPSYIRSLRGPLPDIHYWVSGQVGLDEIGDYLRAGVELIGLTSALTADLPDDPVATDAAVRARAALAMKAIADARGGSALLTIALDDRQVEIDLKGLEGIPATERISLDTVLPGRRGQAVRLRLLLQSAGVPPEAVVRLASDDGFERTVRARELYDRGLLHYATDGHPLGRDQGGPLRLYIVQGADQCDNLKGLSRIETVRPT